MAHQQQPRLPCHESWTNWVLQRNSALRLSTTPTEHIDHHLVMVVFGQGEHCSIHLLVSIRSLHNSLYLVYVYYHWYARSVLEQQLNISQLAITGITVRAMLQSIGECRLMIVSLTDRRGFKHKHHQHNRLSLVAATHLTDSTKQSSSRSLSIFVIPFKSLLQYVSGTINRFLPNWPLQSSMPLSVECVSERDSLSCTFWGNANEWGQVSRKWAN